jgi:hypothetical protein
LGSGSGLSDAFDVHSSQLFDVYMKVGYTNEDGRLIGEQFELVWEWRNPHMELGTVG